MKQKKALLLTLVHPTYLPPVYALAQVIRDNGWDVHILTFDGDQHSTPALGSGIRLESVGRHAGLSLMGRLKIRSVYKKRAHELLTDRDMPVLSFCAYSYLVMAGLPSGGARVYHALELSDFLWRSLRRSPLSQINNWLALRKLHTASLVTTPSAQRSAWLAGRARLSFMPSTVCNTAYLGPETSAKENYSEQCYRLIGEAHRGRTIILYMGVVNHQVCVQELVQGFGLVERSDMVLVIAGIKDNAYGQAVQQLCGASAASERIVTFPFVGGSDKEALQRTASIGVCLNREQDDDVESKMTAPNKVGEYLAAGLYVIASATNYTLPIAHAGVAALCEGTTPNDIAKAIEKAAEAIAQPTYKNHIAEYVHNYYNMATQAAPILKHMEQKG